MSAKAPHSTPTIAVIGNPNTGKSTLFSALAGMRQRIGNYPGVTVEKKIGRIELGGRHATLIDLPGCYSLAPQSPDEMVAVDVLLSRQQDTPPVDAVLSIVDASNLERNLYLVSQTLELGLPTVIALNMIDVARDRGFVIDVERLSRQLGVPVVTIQANRRIGLVELKAALAQAIETPAAPPASPFPIEFQREVDQLQDSLATVAPNGTASRLPRYLVERLLLDASGYLQSRVLNGEADYLAEPLAAARKRLADAGHRAPAVEAISRYAWVARMLEGVVTRPAKRIVTFGDRIDRVLTNKIWGTLVFALLMLVVFSSVFLAAAPLMQAIDNVINAIGGAVESRMAEGALRSLLIDGVIGGVGSVLVFLPQIMILFFFIAVLEDCGYMARAAYLMDKLMFRVGLSGKSFIPLLSSFACAIPGIMSARVIENRRDRLTTILVAPLMSCSARLPVYTIMIAAFIPARRVLGGVPLQGLTLLAMYLLGIVTAVGVAFALKRTLLRGAAPPFVLELPSYKWPAPTLILERVGERAWGFVYRAGTLILAVSILIWALSYYPHDAAAVARPQQAERAALAARLSAGESADAVHARLTELDNLAASEFQRRSYLGRMGRTIEPVVRPLGWDWRIGCAAIASFPAREVVMGALGVIYNLGKDVDVGDQSDQMRLADSLRNATWDDSGAKVFNIPVALSIMVFFALCAQCASTLVIIKRETNTWRWPAFAFAYMTTLAYVGALITYQAGMWLGLGA